MDQPRLTLFLLSFSLISLNCRLMQGTDMDTTCTNIIFIGLIVTRTSHFSIGTLLNLHFLMDLGIDCNLWKGSWPLIACFGQVGCWGRQRSGSREMSKVETPETTNQVSEPCNNQPLSHVIVLPFSWEHVHVLERFKGKLTRLFFMKDIPRLLMKDWWISGAAKALWGSNIQWQAVFQTV